MLKIRKQQLHTLRTQRLAPFRDDAMDTIREHWPKTYEALGPRGAQRLIDKAIEQTGKHNIDHEAQILRFLNLLLAFGGDFSQTLKTAWAHKILSDGRRHPDNKMDALVEGARQQLQEELPW